MKTKLKFAFWLFVASLATCFLMLIGNELGIACANAQPAFPTNEDTGEGSIVIDMATYRTLVASNSAMASQIAQSKNTNTYTLVWNPVQAWEPIGTNISPSNDLPFGYYPYFNTTDTFTVNLTSPSNLTFVVTTNGVNLTALSPYEFYEGNIVGQETCLNSPSGTNTSPYVLTNTAPPVTFSFAFPQNQFCVWQTNGMVTVMYSGVSNWPSLYSGSVVRTGTNGTNPAVTLSNLKLLITGSPNHVLWWQEQAGTNAHFFTVK